MQRPLRERLNISKKPIKRDLHAVILLNKPLGFSSNAALQKVKYHLRAKKAGHTGSLDPLATGVLPICLGRATKFAQHLLNADKTYSFSMRLGEQTSTADTEGDVIATKPVPEISQASLQKICDEFIGAYAQVPPMYSALKKDGQPLYKLARAGKTIDRPARNVSIYSLQVLSGAGRDWTLQVKCSKGTYVRTLAEDIAAKIDTLAHVTMLSRTAIGDLHIDDAIHLDDLIAQSCNQSSMRDIGVLLSHLPQYEISLLQQRALSVGRQVAVSPDLTPNQNYALRSSAGLAIGVGQVTAPGVMQALKML
jgi:tRNA pseudouridine55 synthase